MKGFLKVGLIVCYAACGASIAFGKDADFQEALRGQLVVIDAQADFKIKPQPARKAQSHKMGFVISDDGLILTTYSLISSLGPDQGEIEPELIEISAAPAAPSRPTGDVPAVIYSEDIRHNLLLLRAKDLKRTKYLALGDSSAKIGSLVTMAYGPSNSLYQYASARTSVNSATDLWGTDFNLGVNNGGAPVYDDSSGKIVGILREKYPTDQQYNFVISDGIGATVVVTCFVVAKQRLGRRGGAKTNEKQFNFFLNRPETNDSNVTEQICYSKLISDDLNFKHSRRADSEASSC